MTSETIPPGRVFVSYAREDRERVALLVDYLANNDLDVFWDENIELGVPFRSVLEEALRDAACVVVVWTNASVASQFVRSEAARGDSRGSLVPVKLDASAQIPLGFDELNHLELYGWDGSETIAARKLVEAARKLVERGPNRMSYHGTLSESSAIGQGQRATDELFNLSSRLQSLGAVLVSDSGPARDLAGTLDEVGKTYKAVRSAISRFIAPGLQRGPIDVAPYGEMERGTLIDDIENARGHCTRIQTYYFRHAGLRDSVKRGIDPQLLQDLDGTFAQLSTADGDLFEQLTQIGHVLTNESRAIVNLLVEEQDAAARRRILDARHALTPLEQQLAAAIQTLQRIGGSLGYAAPSTVSGASVSPEARD